MVFTSWAGLWKPGSSSCHSVSLRTHYPAIPEKLCMSGSLAACSKFGNGGRRGGKARGAVEALELGEQQDSIIVPLAFETTG